MTKAAETIAERCSISDQHADCLLVGKVCCEKVRIIDEYKTCLMSATTVINSEGINATFNLIGYIEIKAVTFRNNQNIFYLPNRLGKEFPELLKIDASYCSIKSISRSNFADLHKLIILWLNGNQIETIDGNIFDDLKMIENIALCK
jgi:Leucine-rich repeat (LRR) protein